MLDAAFFDFDFEPKIRGRSINSVFDENYLICKFSRVCACVCVAGGGWKWGDGGWVGVAEGGGGSRIPMQELYTGADPGFLDRGSN